MSIQGLLMIVDWALNAKFISIDNIAWREKKDDPFVTTHIPHIRLKHTFPFDVERREHIIPPPLPPPFNRNALDVDLDDFKRPRKCEVDACFIPRATKFPVLPITRILQQLSHTHTKERSNPGWDRFCPIAKADTWGFSNGRLREMGD